MMNRLRTGRESSTRSRERRDACIHCDNETKFLNGEVIAATPFQNYECECATIGAMLMDDAKAIESAMSRVRPHFFINPRNAAVFSAIYALWQGRHRDGEIVHIDIATVSHQMRMMGVWVEEISSAHLVGCIASCPSAAAILSYVRVLEECAQLRQLLDLGQAMTRIAGMPESPRVIVNASQIVATAKRVLDDIENNKQTNLDDLLEHCK